MCFNASQEKKKNYLLFIPVIPKECGGGLQEVKVSNVETCN